MIASQLVSGVQSMRPAVPARVFGESTRFYEALGFTATHLADDLAEMRLGPHAFLLQDFYVADYANNFVMHLLVHDVDAWWQHIEPLALAEHFAVRAPVAPKLQPWGLRVLFLFDPAGVLWQIASRP